MSMKGREIMKRLFILLMAGILALTFAGCDGTVTKLEAPETQGTTEPIEVLEGEPITPALFALPPDALLRVPEKKGEVKLQAAGFDWTYQDSDGMMTSIIADHSRPLSEKALEPVIIDGRFGQSVVDENGVTNSLGYPVTLAWEVMPAKVSFVSWGEAIWTDLETPEEAVAAYEEFGFYAKTGGNIYEIIATWPDTGAGFYGKAYYYVYIMGGIVESEEHLHMAALTPQTVEDPITGYCGNTQTRLHIGDKTYNFMYERSITLTHILVNLDYDPMKVCRCRPEYTVDTEFGSGYGINLTAGYVRCEKGQADLTVEQIKAIAEIIEWAEDSGDEYLV